MKKKKKFTIRGYIQHNYKQIYKIVEEELTEKSELYFTNYKEFCNFLNIPQLQKKARDIQLSELSLLIDFYTCINPQRRNEKSYIITNLKHDYNPKKTVKKSSKKKSIEQESKELSNIASLIIDFTLDDWKEITSLLQQYNCNIRVNKQTTFYKKYSQLCDDLINKVNNNIKEE